MKPRKILFILSAIGMTLYAVNAILWHIPSIQTAYLNFLHTTPLLRDINSAFWMWLQLGSIILALVAFIVKDKEHVRISSRSTDLSERQNSKRLTYSTIAFTAISVIALITALFNIHYIEVAYMLLAPFYIRIVLLATSIVWLCILAHGNRTITISQKLRIATIIGICIMSLPLLLQLISSIAYLSTGCCLYLRSHRISFFVRYLVPTSLLILYSLELAHIDILVSFRKIRSNRNSHCTEGSFLEKAYPIVRIIIFIVMALFALSILFSLFAARYKYYIPSDDRSYWGDHLNLWQSIEDWSGMAALCFYAVMWLLLTISAFFFLPNPRGYKIYNWICLGSLFTLLPIAIYVGYAFAGNDIAEIITDVLFWAVLLIHISNMLTNTIRLLAYKIPPALPTENN